MVSLRERKARPSYAIISEGLANLTSEEEDSDDEAGEDAAGSEGPVDGGGIGESSTGPGIKKERKGSVSSSASGSGGRKVDADEDDSMSSGDSSEFAPSDEGNRKGKRGKKGRGGQTKKTGQKDSASSGSDSEYEAEGVAEELRELDDDEMIDEDEDEDDSGLDILGTPPASPAGHSRSRLPKPKTGKPTIIPRLPPPGLDNNPGRRINRTLAAPPVYLQSDLNLLLPAYRQFIKSSAEGMVKAPPVRVWSYEKHKVISSEGFPGGNTVPFITRLTAPPGDKGGRVKIVKAGERDKRRRKAIELEKEMIIGLGWEAWEGEGWWPEMFSPGSGSGEGGGGKLSGVVKGWKLREEISLGLENVGRYGIEQLVFVDEADRQRYLPGSSRGTATTVHLGPHDNQRPVTIDIFQQVNMQNHPLKEGYIFSAGGPIWGLDWCPVPSDQGGGQIGLQYLAVTTLPNIESKAPMGEKCSREATSGIQIWSVALPNSDTRDPGGMRCEMVLCVKGGHGMACKWMPMGARDHFDPADQDQTPLPKLGILAVIQLDGSVSVYSVPHPLAARASLGTSAGDRNKPLFLNCHEPSLRIELADTTAACMDWLTGSKLAVGYTNGSVGIWDIATALKEGERENILPHVYVNVAQSCIASIAVGRMPPSDINGTPVYDGEPTKIVIGSHDGSFAMLDMRSPHQPVILGRSRIPCLTVGWTGQSQCPLYTDSEYNIIIYKIRGIPTQRNATVTPHRGPIWDMSSSEYHTMLATAGSDGSVIIAPMQLGLYRYRKQPLSTWRSLEMDYDKQTGHYRLTDNFLPENTSLDTAHGRKTRVGKLVGKDSPIALKVGQWAPHVGIHKVAWNNSGGIARAGMLAVGTASGLGIVDIISPKWKTWAPHVQEYFGS